MVSEVAVTSMSVIERDIQMSTAKKAIIAVLGTMIVLVLAFFALLIGSNANSTPRTEAVPREQSVRNRNEPVELTGTLNRKTPEEIFNESSPYDLGTPAFAHEWIDPPSRDVGSSTVDSDTVYDDYPYDFSRDGEVGRNINLEYEILYEINVFRSQYGVGALVWDEDLFKYAEIRAWEILNYDKFEHERPNNAGMWWDLLLDDNYDVWAANENLARLETYVHEYNGNPAVIWVELWAGSPPHYNEMKSSEYTHLAVCVVYGVFNGVVSEVAVTLYASY